MINSKVRYENIELLRLVAIIFVVCIHYVGWGGVAGSKNLTFINFAFAGCTAVACNCAVNCFYLISGYFIREEETFESCKKRILKIWLPTLFYSISIPLLLMSLGIINLKTKQIVYLFFPIFSNQYWFSTCFIAITSLLPFIAILFRNLNNKMLISFLTVLMFWDSIQLLLGVNAFSNIGYGVVHALTMYTIGYTIRRINFSLPNWKCVSLFVLCVGLIGIITIASIRLFGDRNRTIADYNSIIMIIQSVSIFLFFKNQKITFDFSRFSPYIFGVYLLNDNAYARNFLWQKLLRCSDFYNSIFLPVHLIFSVLGFVVLALCLEYFRVKITNLLFSRVGVL